MSSILESRPSAAVLAEAREASRRRLGVKALAMLALVAIAIIYLGPLLTVLNVSLKSSQAFNLSPTSIAAELRFSNFTEAWKRANFPVYVSNSIVYTAVATLIYAATAVFVAFPISRKYVRGSGFLFGLYVVAMFLPSALVPQFQMMLHLHLYNTRLGYILLFLVNPMGIIILVNYISSVPRELDEAATMDGCGYARFVAEIIFPLVKPALASVIVLHAIGVWNDYATALIYLPKKALMPITRGLMVFYGQFGNDWTVLSAAMLMLMLPMAALFLALQRWIIDGILQGSVKS
jgi:raffinose/stachyose/melibiose transport system permease protein